ncbi:MAG TPA: ABC transporter substrate-binding protein [Nitrospira sp.]|nr:ABC transporter substrate-binding protein [Nitrospira sp.]
MPTLPLLFGGLAMVMMVVSQPATSSALTPTETVAATITTVMDILNDPVYQQLGMADARRVALENVVRNAVNYREMARRSLGITWTVLTESERQRFSELFVQLLRDAVASRVNMYSMTKVVVLSEEREGNFAEVRTLFKGDKKDTAVDVRLVNQSDRWLMYDAVIDGVRLVDNYRSQFIHVMKDGAYAGLIGRLEAMLLIPKAFERTVTQ